MSDQFQSGRLYLIISFLLIIHSAYSMIQFKHFLLATHKLQSIPTDIIFECIIALILCVYGSTLQHKQLRPIKLCDQYNERSIESVNPCTSEYVNVRSRAIILEEIKHKANKRD